MHLQNRIAAMVSLGQYMKSDDPQWLAAKTQAYHENNWFTPEFIDLAVDRICSAWLSADALHQWTVSYGVPEQPTAFKNIGLVMAGNIPLVGFHDYLSVFISGYRQTIKASSKDSVLIRHLTEWLYRYHDEIPRLIGFAPMLKGCDAYIATGSNNSARYFEYYFGKYPHLIRRNRSSAALLSGQESATDLEKLADDVHQYFGLGCRNVTKLLVPANYDFQPLLKAFEKYAYLAEHHKYKNNYDYQLALLILNKQFYMTNGSVILAENPAVFSPISVLHYEYYTDPGSAWDSLRQSQDLQCLVGKDGLPFGSSQEPRLTDYADGIDTMQFLQELMAV